MNKRRFGIQHGCRAFCLLCNWYGTTWYGTWSQRSAATELANHKAQAHQEKPK